MTQEIIEMMKANTSFPEKKIEKMVTTFISRLKERDANISDDDANEVAMAAFKAKYMPVKKPGTEVNGCLCIGYGRIRDENKSLFDATLKEYEADPEGAIARGIVKINEKGDPVVIDTREFIDKEGNYSNNNFGKPLEHIEYRQAQFLVDGKIISGNIRSYVFQPMLFGEYNMVGYVGKFIKPTSGDRVHVFDYHEMWDKLYNLEVDEMCSLDELYDRADWDIVITHGYVRDSYDIVKTGSRCILLDDTGIIDPIPCYDYNEEVFDLMGSIVPGNEVIVVGQVRVNGDTLRLNVLGVVTSPKNSVVQELMDDLE
jgi:hypothetical protein